MQSPSNSLLPPKHVKEHHYFVPQNISLYFIIKIFHNILSSKLISIGVYGRRNSWKDNWCSGDF